MEEQQEKINVFEHIPVMEIEGKFYKMRRLGHKSVPQLLQLGALFLTDGFERLKIRMKFLRQLGQGFTVNKQGELNAEEFQQYFGLLTIAFGAEELLTHYHGFLTKHLRHTDAEGKKRGPYVTLQELDDEELFPSYSLVQILIWMTFHPDFEMMKQAVLHGTQIPFFQQAIEDVSDLAQEGLQNAFQQMNSQPATPTSAPIMT